MNWTTIKMSELMRNKNLRMDPKYWLKKKAASHKPQAASAHKEIGFKNFKYYLKKRLETDTIKK